MIREKLSSSNIILLFVRIEKGPERIEKSFILNALFLSLKPLATSLAYTLQY